MEDEGGESVPADEEITDDGGIRVEGVPPEQNSAFREAIDQTELNWLLTPEANGYVLTLRQPVLADIRQRTLAQSVETIRNRIDRLGVTEPTIQERGQGEYEILVQLPGVDDPQRVKELIQTTALLEIKKVLLEAAEEILSFAKKNDLEKKI